MTDGNGRNIAAEARGHRNSRWWECCKALGQQQRKRAGIIQRTQGQSLDHNLLAIMILGPGWAELTKSDRRTWTKLCRDAVHESLPTHHLSTDPRRIKRHIAPDPLINKTHETDKCCEDRGNYEATCENWHTKQQQHNINSRGQPDTSGHHQRTCGGKITRANYTTNAKR